MHMNDSIPRLILDRAPDGLNQDKVRSNRVRYVRMERSSLSESQSFRLIASRSLAMRLKVSHARRTQLANRVDTDKYRSYLYSRPSVPTQGLRGQHIGERARTQCLLTIYKVICYGALSGFCLVASYSRTSTSILLSPTANLFMQLPFERKEFGMLPFNRSSSLPKQVVISAAFNHC